jgi:hypothetical protein
VRHAAHVSRGEVASLADQRAAVFFEKQRLLHAAAKAAQDEFCAALVAEDFVKLPSFATKARIAAVKQADGCNVATQNTH